MEDYANPNEIRHLFRNRLAVAFKVRYLDEITKRDVVQYYEDRLSNRGPFKGWKRKVGLRAPQTEITALSAPGALQADAARSARGFCAARDRASPT